MTRHIVHARAAIAVLWFAAGVCQAGETPSSKADEGNFDFSLTAKDEASPADAGLPKYPGSKPYKDAGSDSDAASLGLSAGSFGLKVVAMNLETSDKPERVASFYRRALAKYGDVLDCSDPAGAKRAKSSKDDLVCEPGDTEENNIVYKVGTDDNQRIVAVKPHGSGTRFSLVHVETRGD